MRLEMDVRYNDQEKALLERVVKAANEQLKHEFTGSGRRYFIAYIELGSERFEDEQFVREPLHYLAAGVSNTEF